MNLLKFFLILLAIFITSCNKNTDRIGRSEDAVSDKYLIENILAFSASVDHLSKGAVKQESLVYNLGDYSFYVSRYLRNSVISLYIEHSRSGEYGQTERRYYLKDGKVVLLIQKVKFILDDIPFRTIRSFYQNGNLIYSDKKTALTELDLQTAKYKMTEVPNHNVTEDIKKLKNAIYQREEFDLVFYGIAEYPKAKYLILSRNKFNAYRAPILVEKEDDFIKAIFSNPEKYRGRKLKISWTLRKPNEVIYVSGGFP